MDEEKEWPKKDKSPKEEFPITSTNTKMDSNGKDGGDQLPMTTTMVAIVFHLQWPGYGGVELPSSVPTSPDSPLLATGHNTQSLVLCSLQPEQTPY
ncbi:hypothetical protein CR513_27015, partial [Mucuna pruriens]